MKRTRWIRSPSEVFSDDDVDDDEFDGSFSLIICSDFLKFNSIYFEFSSFIITYIVIVIIIVKENNNFTSFNRMKTSEKSTGYSTTTFTHIEFYLVSKTPLSSSDNCVELDELSSSSSSWSCSFELDNSGITICNWSLRLSPFVSDFLFDIDLDFVEPLIDLLSSRNAICSVHVL